MQLEDLLTHQSSAKIELWFLFDPVSTPQYQTFRTSTRHLAIKPAILSRVIFLTTNTSLPKVGKRPLIGPYLRTEAAARFSRRSWGRNA